MRPDSASFVRLKLASRLAISWLHQTTCQVKSVSWLTTATDYLVVVKSCRLTTPGTAEENYREFQSCPAISPTDRMLRQVASRTQNIFQLMWHEDPEQQRLDRNKQSNLIQQITAPRQHWITRTNPSEISDTEQKEDPRQCCRIITYKSHLIRQKIRPTALIELSQRKSREYDKNKDPHQQRTNKPKTNTSGHKVNGK